MRRIQTLTTEKRANTAWSGRRTVGFLQDALFILRGESASLGFGHHFGIRVRRRHRSGARFGCRSTSLRLTPFAFAPFRASRTSGERTTPREFPFISFLCFLALLIN